jgi:hypothetical protein
MSYFRSYFLKNNTLLKNTSTNTSKNPTTEIYYGGGYSRFIFTVDFTNLKNKIDNGELVIDSNTRHYLKMTNTVVGDPKLIGNDKFNGKQRATSFELQVFQLTEEWDEGVGYDYVFTKYSDDFGNRLYDQRPSNWFNKTTLDEWEGHGAFTSGSTIIGTKHFDNGNENIDIDITDYVNGIILSGNTNYGVGIKFTNQFEDIDNLTPHQSVSFFTKYTQTFFEPFVESVFDDRIEDNRLNFITEKNNNLYLYVTKGTNYYDLDQLPTVDILNSTNTPLSGLTDLTPTKVRKGIYKITFGVSGQICDGKRFFYDKWKNLIIDGVSINDVTQKFIPRPFTDMYSIGENRNETNSYKIQFSGIKQNEKILRGELKKIVLNLKTINQTKSLMFNDSFYRIFIKEGKTNVIVYDWTKMDITNEISFFLDTSYLIPREYFMEFKIKVHNEEIYYVEYLKFEIISEK